MTKHNGVSHASPVVELAKALSWPLLAAVLLMALWSPLRETAKEVPRFLRRSEVLTIAGVSLRVRQDLYEQASAEVRDTIARLSPTSLERLMGFGGSGDGFLSVSTEGGSQTLNSQVGELLRLGLMKETPPTDTESLHFRNFQLTPLGKEARSFLFAVVSEFVDQLAHAQQARDVEE